MKVLDKQINFDNVLQLRACGLKNMRGVLEHFVGLVADTATNEFAVFVGGELGGEEDKAVGFDGLGLCVLVVSVVYARGEKGGMYVVRANGCNKC